MFSSKNGPNSNCIYRLFPTEEEEEENDTTVVDATISNARIQYYGHDRCVSCLGGFTLSISHTFSLLATRRPLQFVAPSAAKSGVALSVRDLRIDGDHLPATTAHH